MLKHILNPGRAMLFHDGFFGRICVALQQYFRRFVLDVIPQDIKPLVGHLCFVIDAARLYRYAGKSANRPAALLLVYGNITRILQKTYGVLQGYSS